MESPPLPAADRYRLPPRACAVTDESGTVRSYLAL